MPRKRVFVSGRSLVSGASLLMLAACGGGSDGGVNSASSNPSSTTTTTPTTPTAPVIVYTADAEYNRSNGAGDSGALTAWNSGATGTGETIAIIDTGINTNSAEFAGRISAASTDIVSNRTVTDTDGHGTAIAGVAAAAHNGSDIEGVAFNATILALRVDTVGSCATSGGCTFNTTNIAAAVDAATQNGAKVINLSLGGGGLSTSLTNALSRATAAGVIVVVAAGNDADANPDVFAQFASNPSIAHGLAIIAGSHDADGTYSSYANKAGTFGNYFLTALGNQVRSFDQTGTDFLYTGTSFSTPIIAGAVALLEQAFPNLTPAQIVALLYSSATDAGTTGVDSTYGRGILNIAKAFAPIGTTALAGSQIAVAASDQTTLSSAMGDASLTGQSAGRAIVLDALGRAYTMNLAANVARPAVTRPLVQGIGSDFHGVSQSLGPLSVATTIARRFTGASSAGLALDGRGFDQSVSARPVDGSVALTLTPQLRASVAFAEQGRILADNLTAAQAPGSFLVARGTGDTPGFATRTGMSFGIVRSFGRTNIVMTAERGTVAPTSITDRSVPPRYAGMAMRAERLIGPLVVKLDFASLREDGTVLGARLAPAFGQSGATTRYADMDARLTVGHGWSLGAAWRNGWTRTDAGGVLDHSAIVSRSATADIARETASSRLALRVALPPRVNAGGLTLTLPSTYDYATGAIGYSTGTLGLTPQGQERDIEASYGFSLGGGWIDTNLYWRHQPGNIALAPEDIGTALRYSLSF